MKAKTIGYIVVFLVTALVAAAIYDYFKENDYVTNETFTKAHDFLNKRVDTVIDNQTEIIYNQMELKRLVDSVMLVTGNIDKNQAMQILKTDSILASQKMIYNEVSGKNNWAEKLLNWIE